MKSLFLILSLIPILGFAQGNQAILPPPRPAFSQGRQQMQGEPARPFAENFRITLAVSGKEKQATELSLVVASPDFNVTSPGPKDSNGFFAPSMDFSGTITPEESGTVLIRYSLSAAIPLPTQTVTSQSDSGKPVTSTSIAYQNSGAHATVRVKMGQPLQILKASGCVYFLTVSRVDKGAENAQ